MISAYERVGEYLRDHAQHAPAKVEDSVIDLATETARECRIPAQIERSYDVLNRTESAVQKAEDLKKAATSAQQEVGW